MNDTVAGASSSTGTNAWEQDAPATTPKLRFPEFRGTAGWQSVYLDSVLIAVSNGLSLPQSVDNTGYKVTRIETISAGNIDLKKVGYVTTIQDISSYRLNLGDILFSNINSVAHIGKTVYLDKHYGLYHGLNLLRFVVNTHTCDSKFLFYQINTSGIREYFRARANKAVNQASINQTEVGKTLISVPTLAEQQRIADCLSSLDALIAAQARKVDALKTHKKGLMQQLFPRAGETQPRLRFPEFQDAGEWEENFLHEVLSLVVRERQKPTNPYIGLGLRSHGKGTFLKPLQDPSKNSMDVLYKVSSNDLIVNITFAWEGAIAIAQQDDEGALVSHRFPTYTFEKNRTMPDFFRYIILDKQFIYRLGLISPGGAGRNRVMSKTDFLKLKVALPPSLAEQQRISDCLSSLDALITAEAHTLDTLKTHKKGLMQQLFPAPEDATA